MFKLEHGSRVRNTELENKTGRVVMGDGATPHVITDIGSYLYDSVDDMIKSGWVIDIALQERVVDWIREAFGDKVLSDTPQRCHRFIEEAIELVQACGLSRSECERLLEYVYSRPPGAVAQEVGGVMLTLAGLCSCVGVRLEEEAERELRRTWANIDAIRQKQASKPRPAVPPLHQFVPKMTSRECEECGYPEEDSVHC